MKSTRKPVVAHLSGRFLIILLLITLGLVMPLGVPANQTGSGSSDSEVAWSEELEAVVPHSQAESSARSRELNKDEDVAKRLIVPIKAATPGWTTILFESVEGSFPTGNDWNTFDANDASGEDYWDDLFCRYFNGSWSVWSADIGDQTDCVNYDNDMRSWMVYGPFSLADAADARVEFQVWSETERPDIPYDYFFWGASVNGNNFHGSRLTINTDWLQREFDLTNVPTLGDLTGEPEVWFAFLFNSDSSINSYEGTYVDDILIENQLTTCYPLTRSHNGSGSDPVAIPVSGAW